MIAPYMPTDPTKEEVSILSHVAASLYRRIKDPEDKFIIAMVFELGYGKEETAWALGCSYEKIYLRVKRIEGALKEAYRIKEEKQELKV